MVQRNQKKENKTKQNTTNHSISFLFIMSLYRYILFKNVFRILRRVSAVVALLHQPLRINVFGFVSFGNCDTVLPPRLYFDPSSKKDKTQKVSVLTPPFSSKPPNTRALFRKKSSSPRLLNHRFFLFHFTTYQHISTFSFYHGTVSLWFHTHTPAPIHIDLSESLSIKYIENRNTKHNRNQ